MINKLLEHKALIEDQLLPRVQPLIDIADLEQTISTGETDINDEIDVDYLSSKLKSIYDNPTINLSIKKRILTLCAVRYPETDFLSLVENISADDDNYHLLSGLKILSPSNAFTAGKSSPVWRYQQEGWNAELKEKDSPFSVYLNKFFPQNPSPDYLNRYTPTIERILLVYKIIF